MSLGGIAIAIGAMVDAGVVMIENAHKKLEAWRHAHDGADPAPAQRVELITQAAVEVGPALFFSLLIVTLSFVPVFTLQAQEGRLFAPLAYTKTYAMAAAAGLSVTLIPVLMIAFIRGRMADESANPLNRLLIRLYRPVIAAVLARPVADAGGRRPRDGSDGVADQSPRQRVHAAARRRRSVVHADRAAGSGRWEGIRDPATDRSHPEDVPRSGARVRQDGPRRNGHRSGAARDDGDDADAEAEIAMARGTDD